MGDVALVRSTPVGLPLEGLLKPSDRVLILGGGGWFGRSTLALFSSTPMAYKLHIVASSSRALRMRSHVWNVKTWDWQIVADFKPTVVLNYAFLTRDRIADLGISEYERQNRELLRRYERAARLPSVRAVVSTSSGAVVQGPEDSYCVLKRVEEELTESLRSARRATVIARAFSVSGPWVQRPHSYAFSDMVMQAAEGHIQVRASQPTFRRFVDAGEFLAVCAALALRGTNELVESGGELIEMRSLAETVRDQVNREATIAVAGWASRTSAIYASDGSSWDRACHALGVTPANLVSQIRRTHRGLVVSP